MITTWYLQSHRTWDRSRHSCIGSPSSPWGPSRRASLCRLTIRGTPDRSKLFGSHGQRPWLHDVVISAPLPFPSGTRRVLSSWMCSDEAAMASIKVFDPVSVPLSVLEELQQLRAQVEQLRQENERLHQENERLRQENERLQRELEGARVGLDQAQRQSKRQAAPFSKGPPKPQPKKPGRKSGKAHGRHGHRLLPSPAAVDEILEAPLPDACPRCGGSVRETEVATQDPTEIPRHPLIRQFHVHVGCCCGCGQRVQGRHPLQTSDALGGGRRLPDRPRCSGRCGPAEQDLWPVP